MPDIAPQSSCTSSWETVPNIAPQSSFVSSGLRSTRRLHHPVVIEFDEEESKVVYDNFDGEKFQVSDVDELKAVLG